MVPSPLVVATTPGREAWLRDCLDSLPFDRETLVLSDFSWEVGKIRYVYEYTSWDTFILFHDTCLIKDPSFLEAFDNYPGSVSLSDCPVKMGMYLGKYTRDTLSKVVIPVAYCKEDSIRYETEFAKKYCDAEGSHIPTIFPDFHDDSNNGFTVRHGRKNMILENDYLIKFKGTWKWPMDDEG